MGFPYDLHNKLVNIIPFDHTIYSRYQYYQYFPVNADKTSSKRSVQPEVILNLLIKLNKIVGLTTK